MLKLTNFDSLKGNNSETWLKLIDSENCNDM